MIKPSLLDRRLAETPEPFRSGARALAASMRDEFVADNAIGTPPVVSFVDRIKLLWPTLQITDNIKAVAGMIVAEALAPEYVTGRRKTAPRGSCMASGTLFILASTSNLTADFHASGLGDDGLFELARETLERAAETFVSIKAGKPFDQRRRDHMRLAITSLQMANAESI